MDGGLPKVRLAALLGRTIIAGLWLAVGVLAAAVGLELLPAQREARGQDDHPRLTRLSALYAPFTVQHLHPNYLFFFPLSPTDRQGLSNEVCTLDADGFRGPGPGDRNGRRLAFVLGGSTAFGHFASSDAGTITGRLNALQDEYHFVNAGVPSWNSGQELLRLAHQLLVYDPALVVVLDGANDAAIPAEYWERGVDDLPAGSPESFDLLVARVAGVPLNRDDECSTGLACLFRRLARRLGTRVARHGPRVTTDLPGQAVNAAVAVYLRNHASMRALTEGSGARYLSIFQPIAGLHLRVPDRARPGDWGSAVARFHQRAMARARPAADLHDFARVFDTVFDEVPVLDGDIEPGAIFVDNVHLHDAGNQIVAERILHLLD